MKIQYKHQKFQADAAKAVVDVFAGQPYLTPAYMMDRGSGYIQQSLTDDADFTGWCNHKIVPELNDQIILEHLRKIQRSNQIQPSDKLEGRNAGYNLTIQMETGTGKTYTYIKTMYELNRAYGWSKFIVIVPSIAIREGVYKSFQMTQEHFAEEYGKKIRFFIYNSAQLSEIDRFASDSSMNVMIINSQSFNAKGKDARRIHMRLDEFRSRRPIDIIAKTNPILIIDEPQSVEGKQTKEKIKQFNPMLTLRYSATHKSDSIYNMVYRLDAMEAYNKCLVKKIAVKGITATGSTAADSYLYLESINLSKGNPTATLQFEMKMSNGISKKRSRIVKEGDNLYEYSNGLEEYKNGFVVSHIDGRDNSAEFINGIKIFAGNVIGAVDEDHFRRIQIRETILSHLQKERQLFYKGIKVLSLFFIDEVANYRKYDAACEQMNGKYASMFEEEYNDILNSMLLSLEDGDYTRYLQAIPTEKTHAGYFSVDARGRMINSKAGRKEMTSDDVSAYELIMKNKELLLDRDPEKSPVRFIFSHSALREGWDNPNVFQICTLKQSSSDIRKRQEVGRGLRLCVNQNGERMDINALGSDVHNVNVLTVIASESYDSFAKELQTEMAEETADRPKTVTRELFANRIVRDDQGNETVITSDTASAIFFDLIVNGYISRLGELTDKYYEDKADCSIRIAEEAGNIACAVLEILDSIYDSKAMQPEDARGNNIELQADAGKLNSKEFQALWSKINAKSVYVVDFDTDELIKKSIESLDSNLRAAGIYFRVETGAMDFIKSKEDLAAGVSFVKEESGSYGVSATANSNVKYDLIGKLVDETGLTRRDVIAILQGIKPAVFNQFKGNPEEFISKAAQLINSQKAAAVIEHIAYDVLDEHYGTEIFTALTARGRLGVNAMKAEKHLYDYIIYDSSNEREFAADLDTDMNVAVYVKLPDSFYISTPAGRYNPDWAIAFYEGNVKHIYFVAETKGSMNTMQLRQAEISKIHCAREHFKAVSGDNIVYDVVDSYSALMEKVMKQEAGSYV